MSEQGGGPVEGRVLGGRYELGERVGRGGMAEVHRGTDVRLGRDVAVKVLREDLARDPSFQGRFRREAQAAASLNAPSIVSVYDTGEDASAGTPVPYIVMEYVEGRTLRDVLLEEGRLLPQRALEIAADVCAALEVAHRAGIVHRDIKPGNVMLTRTGEVKVMDFGIARAAADTSVTMTQTAAVIGTAAYLSPEQARGEHVDQRSDLYSTGCLLYELVTGAPPFTGDSAVAVAYQHVREDPEPPSSYDGSLSPDVDAVVLKAMAKNPANRYQTATEMREDLLRAAAGEAVLATPVLEPVTTLAPAAVVAPPERDRRRGLVYTLFGLLLVAIAIGVALLVRGVLGPGSDLVPAPDVVGLSQQQAALRLAEAGLTVGEVTPEFAEAPPGTVLRQTPPQGIVVQRGGTVDLVVSEGVEQTIVPEQVIGRSRDEAELLLGQAKLVVERVVQRDGNIPAGRVLEISPPPGTQLPAGSAVVLTVASGQVEVPDVRGRSQGEAAAVLQEAGFSVAVELRDDPGEPDRVLAQDPVNARAARGSTVRIVVSQTPAPAPPPSPEPEPTETPSPSPSPATSPPSPASPPAEPPD
ncbi:MAG TPA: Stk1 family PASTA domain-containing Ser/Thr kinase [Mycobacteriales bacterium]|nr:Stk1 family PASTA domain-containing Ser/Thr kinase [Mycobacteriales bacterium]